MSYAELLGAADLLAYAVLFAIAVGETSAFLGLLVPGEIALLTAGVLASQGHLDVAPLLAVAVFGAIVGDQLGYLLGRRYGLRWVARFAARPRWQGRFLRVRAWTRGRYGGLAVLLGRFVGYVRPLVPFAAGAAGMHYGRFLTYGVPAAVTWSTGSVLIGIAFGTSGERLIQTFGFGVAAVLAVTMAAGLTIWRIRRTRGQSGSARTDTQSVIITERSREPVSLAR